MSSQLPHPHIGHPSPPPEHGVPITQTWPIHQPDMSTHPPHPSTGHPSPSNMGASSSPTQMWGTHRPNMGHPSPKHRAPITHTQPWGAHHLQPNTRHLSHKYGVPITQIWGVHRPNMGCASPKYGVPITFKRGSPPVPDTGTQAGPPAVPPFLPGHQRHLAGSERQRRRGGCAGDTGAATAAPRNGHPVGTQRGDPAMGTPPRAPLHGGCDMGHPNMGTPACSPGDTLREAP